MSKTEPTSAYEWVKAIIESCESEFHFNSAGILVDLFKKQYPEEKDKKGLLVDLLYDKIQEKFPPPLKIHEA